ncbi:SET domain-containing protein [Nemania sp. NC0429]|nr:SET domain-containing protein [Nemania sp. NC0429]
MASLAERYQALVRWVEAAGGRLHPAVEIYHDEVTKGSLRVKEAGTVGVGEDIVTLPLSCSLSFLNAIAGHPDLSSALPPHIPPPQPGTYFPAEFLRSVPPHVIGRFFLIQEYLRRDHSPWWPYISTLPPPERMTDMLPIVWPTDDVEFLRGTNAHVAVEEIRSSLRKEYKQAVKLLPATLQHEYTRPLYYWAYCIFTTRSFRPSLILPSIESLSLPCKADDLSILLPLFDVGNHSPLAKSAWVTDENSRTCAFRSGQPYSAGQQIYNNYGTKTNVELLLGYGFIFPERDDFHNDYVHIKTKGSTTAGHPVESHLVSLRPLYDASSITGRSRALDLDYPSCLPCFSYFQDSLIIALYESIAQHHGEIATLSRTEIMQGRIPQRLLSGIIASLGEKLTMDLERIESDDPPYEPANPKQELARIYRSQCKKVLENALASLSNASL